MLAMMPKGIGQVLVDDRFGTGGCQWTKTRRWVGERHVARWLKEALLRYNGPWFRVDHPLILFRKVCSRSHGASFSRYFKLLARSITAREGKKEKVRLMGLERAHCPIQQRTREVGKSLG